MPLANEVLVVLKEEDLGDPIEGSIRSFSELLVGNGIFGVEVEISKDGTDWIVDLTDATGQSETLLFGKDEDGAYCLILSSNKDSVSEGDVIDLSPLNPPTLEDGSLDMTNLQWINKSTLSAILMDGNISSASPVISVTAMEGVIYRGRFPIKLPIRHEKHRMSVKQMSGLGKLRAYEVCKKKKK